MVEYAVISTNPKLAIEIDRNSFFYPFEEKQTSIVPVPPLPKYVLGVIELEGDICICIDTRDFLASQGHRSVEMNYNIETVLVKVSEEKGRNHFALKIPLPEVMDLGKQEITWERLILRTKPLPYRPATIRQLGPSLIFTKESLTPFLLSEIGAYLREEKEKTFPKWIREEEGLAKNSPHRDIPLNLPNFMGVQQSKKEKKISVLKVGDDLFGVEEDLVLGIEPVPKTITPVPQAPPWVIGLWKSQYEPTVVIDMAHLLNLDYSKQVKDQMIMVVRDTNTTFALLCDEVLGSFNYKEFSQQVERDESTVIHAPVSDIFRTPRFERPILALNIEFLRNCAKWSMEDLQKSRLDWIKLLSNMRNRRETERGLEDYEKIFENDAFVIPRGKIDFVLPQTYVVELSPAFQVERVNHRDAVFAGYRNFWIPSFHLGEFIDGEKNQEDETYGFSIFVTTGVNFVELITPNVDLGKMGEPIKDNKGIETLLSQIERQFITDVRKLDGRYQLEINLQNLIGEAYEKVARMLNRNQVAMEALQELIDQPAPDTTSDLIEEGYFGIWREDGLPFLVVTDGEHEMAIPLRKIERIVRNPEEFEEEREIIPWKGRKPEISMYVAVEDGKGVRAYEMPISAKLVILSSEEVIKDEMNTYIVLDGSNVPILET